METFIMSRQKGGQRKQHLFEWIPVRSLGIEQMNRISIAVSKQLTTYKPQ